METHIGDGNLMKKAFLTVMLLCLFVLGTHDAQAQVYAPGYYDQSRGGTESYSEQYDPYQELETMHHRYLPQFQPPYSPYQIYPYLPCCVPRGY